MFMGYFEGWNQKRCHGPLSSLSVDVWKEALLRIQRSLSNKPLNKETIEAAVVNKSISYALTGRFK